MGKNILETNNIMDGLEFYNVYKLRVKFKSDEKSGDFVLEEIDQNILDSFIKFYICRDVFPYYLDDVLYAKNSNGQYFIIKNKLKSLYSIFIPKNDVDLITFFNTFKDFIESLRKKRIIHFNLTPRHFLYNKDEFFCLEEDFKITSFNAFSKRNPILGSTIIGPVQVLYEMLNSSLERDSIPYVDFKKKFVKFYSFISKDNILWICQKYFSIDKGASDYIDFIINKLCIIQNNYVIKDDSKLLSYIQFIDSFAFAMVLHYYSEHLNIVNKDINSYIIDRVLFN